MKHASLLTSAILIASVITGACTSQAPEKSGPEAVALNTVADTFGISRQELTVTDSRTVEFNDASLGCPQTGMMYAQVITPGYRILVEHQERTFDVRVSGDFGQVCDKPGKNFKPAEDRTR